MKQQGELTKLQFNDVLSPTPENLIPVTEDEAPQSSVAEISREEVSISEETLRVINALQSGYRVVERRGHEINEAETRQLLVEPVLAALGFPASHRRPEDGDRGNRPDELCYDREVQADLVEAAIILEAKALSSDFDVPEQPGRRTSSPDRQIQRYLRQHVASGPSTVGILTDGVRWRVYERSGSDIALVVDYDFGSAARQFWRSATSFGTGLIEQFDEFIAIATRCFARPARLVVAPEADPVIELLKTVAEGGTPTEILHRFTQLEEIEPRYDIADQVALTGLLEDTFGNDWEEHVYVIGPDVVPEGQISLSDQLTIGVVKFKHSEWGLGRGDAAASARILARAAGSKMSVLFVYSEGPDGSIETRVAACADGQVNMTAAFDPELPLPSARTAIGDIIAKLASDEQLIANDILGPLEVMPLRQRFYREVSSWTWELQRDRDSEYRHAVLKHLIRVIFTWILKEEGIIPPELFEYAYVGSQLGDADEYHSEVLAFLFHERLNVIEDQREPHSIGSLNEILDRAPFLNGSLFAKDVGDPELQLPIELYWSIDEENPGLFTIFNRYHWTTDEHRPGESEQTMDPELLSNLFEQLITPTEEGREAPPRQPRGTYYTPADVADEMVKDALTAALQVRLPNLLTDVELLNLFGDPDESAPLGDANAKAILAEQIASLRIFDPAVGSGEFLFSCLMAIKTALTKLNGDYAHMTREIIKDQLSGQDINPLATQITRLRLFVAIVSAEKGDPTREPLPNLEARVVCADSLETVADPGWRPDRPSSLGDVDPGFTVALTGLAENRRRWFDAHSEEEKSGLREADDALREELNSYLVGNGNETVVSREFKGFVEFPLLGTGLERANTDARLLFYEPEWRGFDIVIGNPPYELLSKSINEERKQDLIRQKGYGTTKSNDLFTLFCEIGLALAKPTGGVVTMIVPLSIAFGRPKRTLREIFEDRCKSVKLRHYDNRPASLFKESFSVKSPPNSQRATIVTAILGSRAQTNVETTGLQRWPSVDRGICVRQRNTILLPRFESNRAPRTFGQWPRIPTDEIAEFVERIAEQSVTVESIRTKTGAELAFPRSARYFLSVTPFGVVQPRRETKLTFDDHDVLRLAMALFNGHVALAWWTIFGDGQDVKLSDFLDFTVPDAWMNDGAKAQCLGQRLIDVVPECFTEPTPQYGRRWQNVNFHKKPELIQELDELHLDALGLSEEPLLSQLKLMCSGRSWELA